MRGIIYIEGKGKTLLNKKQKEFLKMKKQRTINIKELNQDWQYEKKDDSARGCTTVPFYELQIGDKIVIDNYFTLIIN